MKTVRRKTLCDTFAGLCREQKKGSILLANDLDTLLPMYLISKIYKLPLVFDSHEIFSELPTLKPGSIQKKVWQWLERKLVPKVKTMYTVSQSYAKFFQQKYGVEPQVIKNVPFQKDYKQAKIKNTTDINHPKIIIYQGAINYSRGIDKAIEAMQYIENVELWIIGDGPMLQEYKQLAKSKNLSPKIKFFGRKSPEELRKLTPQANVGISLEEDNGLSYRYALPNKIFDYIHAGIPIVGSEELVEVKELIHHYKIGETVNPKNIQEIGKTIQKVLEKPKEQYQGQLNKAAHELNWEAQEQQLVEIFENL